MIRKRYLLLIGLVIIFCESSFAQLDTAALNSVKRFQDHLNAEYKDPQNSPLEPNDLKKFKTLPFFPINLAYRVEAKLIVTDQEPYFLMMTSNNKPRNFRQYGLLEFNLNGVDFKVPVYQSENLVNKEGFADYLFFPFKDLTNDKTSYGAGRYIDLRIPKEGDILILDFNQAYNPLCAYSNRFSCPIVPEKNHLTIEINAGVKYDDKH